MNQDEPLPHLDLRMACVHAAGHAMVARQLGYQSNWWVFASGGEAATWVGRYEVIGNVAAEHLPALSLAGPISVALAADRDTQAADLYERLQSIDEGLMTTLDAAGAGNFGSEDLESTLALVLPMLASIREEAREQPDVATQVKRAKSRQYYT